MDKCGKDEGGKNLDEQRRFVRSTEAFDLSQTALVYQSWYVAGTASDGHNLDRGGVPLVNDEESRIGQKRTGRSSARSSRLWPTPGVWPRSLNASTNSTSICRAMRGPASSR